MAWPVETAYGSALAAIRARVVAQWVDGGLLRTPIQFQDVPGVMNVDGVSVVPEPPADLPWLKLDVVSVDTQAFAFCTNHGTNRNQVLIYLTVYVPRRMVDAANRLIELAGLARQIFSRQHTGDGLRPDVSKLPRRLPEERGCMVAQTQTLCWFYEEVQ